MTFDQIKSHFGSITGVCRGLNVARQTVYLWKKNGIKLERQVMIEVATNGALKADLPDSVRKQAA